MCTITLEYNSSNALARRKLSKLLATGLFHKIEVNNHSSVEEKEEHRELRNVVLENSKRNMSHFIARHI